MRAGLAGMTSRTANYLIQHAEEAGYEVLLTTDKNIRYQQNLSARKSLWCLATRSGRLSGSISIGLPPQSMRPRPAATVQWRYRLSKSVRPMKEPPHPGDFIRTEIIEPVGLTVTAAAAALRVSRPALSSLLNGKAGLSGEMALRIEKGFGVRMDTLMRMQSAYDIAHARKREHEIRVPRVRRPAEIHS